MRVRSLLPLYLWRKIQWYCRSWTKAICVKLFYKRNNAPFASALTWWKSAGKSKAGRKNGTLSRAHVTNCKSPFPFSFWGARCGRASTPNCCWPLPHCWPPTASNPTRVTRSGQVAWNNSQLALPGSALATPRFSRLRPAVAPFSEIASPTWEVRALFFHTPRISFFCLVHGAAAAAVMNSSYPQKFHSLI